MALVSTILAFLMVFSSPAAAVLAQSNTSGATSTPQKPTPVPQNKNGLGIGLGIGAGIVGLGILSKLVSPVPALKSFGGRIVALVPCVSGAGPSIFVTIVPSGAFPPTYIWTPLTITKLAGPPRNPGQQVLGTADIPFVCSTPTVPPVPLYGLRMFEVGTSPI